VYSRDKFYSYQQAKGDNDETLHPFAGTLVAIAVPAIKKDKNARAMKGQRPKR